MTNDDATRQTVKDDRIVTACGIMALVMTALVAATYALSAALGAPMTLPWTMKAIGAAFWATFTSYWWIKGTCTRRTE